MALTLRPLPKWSGQVLSPEGLPVKQFSVQAAPLNDSWVSKSSSEIVPTRKGGLLAFEKPGPHWLAIRAEGYAAWEKIIEVGEQPESLAVRLERGVTVTGQVCGPFRRPREMQVVLVPDRETDEPSSGVIFSWTAQVVDEAMRRVAQRKTRWTTTASSGSNTCDRGPMGCEISGPGITAGEFWIAWLPTTSRLAP